MNTVFKASYVATTRSGSEYSFRGGELRRYNPTVAILGNQGVPADTTYGEGALLLIDADTYFPIEGKHWIVKGKCPVSGKDMTVETTTVVRADGCCWYE